MSIENQFETIKSKLQELKRLDSHKRIFGATSHKYVLNQVVKEGEVIEFENRYGIKLPEDYRMFLLKLGNGGTGPYYGIQTLEDSLYIDLDYKRENELLDPSKPFPISEPWNMEYNGNRDNEKEYEQFEEEYFDEKWETGQLRLCNYGCGVSMNLVWCNE